MVLFDGALGLIAIAVWIFCIIDVITTPTAQVRNLPKLAWLLLVIVLVDIGSIAWLVAGRDWAATATRAQRPSPARAPARASNPDDDEDFLAGLRLRAEEQRRRARETGSSDDDPA